MFLKVGELAKRTGLTVRTLHHYDDIGLLSPSHRSDAGYRLYTRDDLARLHQIQALKQLGLGLAEIGETLATDGGALGDIVARQIEVLDRQAEKIVRLRQQLVRLETKIIQGVNPDVADLLTTLELMTMYEKYFTPDELKYLETRRQKSGVNLDARWAQLVPAMKDLMEYGIDPAHEEPQRLASEWIALAEEMSGNQPDLLLKFDAMTRNEPSVQEQTGIDTALLNYVMACMQARKIALYRKYMTEQELEQVIRGRMQTAAQWPPLIAAMRRQFEQGLEITDSAVQDLAVQWKTLSDMAHADDDGSLRMKLRAAYEQEPELLRGTGLDLPLLDFFRRALAAI
jgi:DNA-binding transcriptional MerR regulator